MSERILIVDSDGDTRERFTQELASSFEVFQAASGLAGLELCQRNGPFAVVISDHAIGDMSGVEFLASISKGWPDSSRIMLTRHAQLELVVDALHDGAIFRFLTKPIEGERLTRTIMAAVERFQCIASERLLTEQLQFSRESLISWTERLETRLQEQQQRLQSLQLLFERINTVATLKEVAQLAAESACEMLGGRNVEVVLEAADAAKPVQALCGADLSAHTYTVRLVTDEDDVGFIRLDEHDRAGRVLREHDREIMSALAAALSSVCARHRSRHQRDEAQQATIYALAHLAENRDDETGRHLERVSLYCRLIAGALRDAGHYPDTISAGWIDDLALSAPLHDIGKVGIPDAILLKPGELDSAEWQVMQTHTTIGAETLRRVLEDTGEQRYLRMAHEITWCHHERWNGNGYPRGLKGEEIPLVARIVALADCYDALTTRRPYKEAWPHQRALEEVLATRGSHFDPQITDVFVKHQAEVNDIRQSLAEH